MRTLGSESDQRKGDRIQKRHFIREGASVLVPQASARLPRLGAGWGAALVNTTVARQLTHLGPSWRWFVHEHAIRARVGRRDLKKAGSVGASASASGV